jgi:hypothetical protein
LSTVELVTRDEIETPRTAAEIRGWIDAALERFQDQPREIRNSARDGKLLWKELAQEALPIALFASCYFAASSAVCIRHVLGSQQYDAEVDDKRTPPSRARFIEVTHSAFDGDDARRMELLSSQGHAPSYGPVIAEGPKGKRTRLEAQLEAHDHLELRAEHIERARQAVVRKARKAYAAGTALVVMVDDSGPFSKGDDRVELARVAQEEFAPLVDQREFCVLAFVGARGLFIAVELSPKS